MKKRFNAGFTLIELMIVVAIMGILAAIAVPKFADLVKSANEGASRGNLASLRSAIAIYYGDNDGLFPSDVKLTISTVLTNTLIPKYLKTMPFAYAPPYHGKIQTVRTHAWTPFHTSHDDGGWGYDSNLSTSTGDWGHVWLYCTHNDSKGNVWYGY